MYTAPASHSSPVETVQTIHLLFRKGLSSGGRLHGQYVHVFSVNGVLHVISVYSPYFQGRVKGVNYENLPVPITVSGFACFVVHLLY